MRSPMLTTAEREELREWGRLLADALYADALRYDQAGDQEMATISLELCHLAQLELVKLDG